jgi:hypothetical protein
VTLGNIKAVVEADVIKAFFKMYSCDGSRNNISSWLKWFFYQTYMRVTYL